MGVPNFKKPSCQTLTLPARNIADVRGGNVSVEPPSTDTEYCTCRCGKRLDPKLPSGSDQHPAPLQLQCNGLTPINYIFARDAETPEP